MEYFNSVESLEYFDMVESFEYYPAQNIPSFKLRICNIAAVCLYLAHSSLRNFCNTMPRHEPVVVIRQPSIYGIGDDDILEFIRCVGRREPQIQKLWSFSEDRITHEIHARATVRRVRDARLQENCMVQAQNVLYDRHIGGDGRVNQSYDGWDDFWDELADQ